MFLSEVPVLMILLKLVVALLFFQLASFNLLPHSLQHRLLHNAVGKYIKCWIREEIRLQR